LAFGTALGSEPDADPPIIYSIMNGLKGKRSC